MELGYRVRKIKNYARTTIPAWFNYPNLIAGMADNEPYRVLQSDITYFDIDGKFYCLVYIIDVYTRELLGYIISDNMRTQSNLKDLNKALKKITESQYQRIIYQSNRGSMYAR